jgi:hypothetical protein
MTDQQHRATPEQWAECEQNARVWSGAFNCILELRDRIAALEASAGIGQPITPANIPAPADSLVERVARTIYEAPNTHEGWRSEARAAIREVAAWLDGQIEVGAAHLLREEASR